MEHKKADISVVPSGEALSIVSQLGLAIGSL